MRWPRRITPARSSTHSGGSRTSSFWPRKAGVLVLPHQHGKGAIGLQHDAGAIERDDAGGNGLDDGFELAAALFDGLVGGGELRGGGFGELAAGVEIGGHVIERAHQLGHLAGRDEATRCSYLPAAISSMASASASTGRVICLERNSASQTLEKKTTTVISSSMRKNVARMLLRERKSCQYSAAPSRMRAVVWLRPCGMGSAATTSFPEALRPCPAHSPDPAMRTTGSSLRWAEVRICGERALQRDGRSEFRAPVSSGSQGIRLAGCFGRGLEARHNAMVLAIDDDEAALERDAVRGEYLLESGASPSGAPVAAIDSASPRALLVTYCASSSTTRVESSRSSDVLGENQRSMERFIS